MVPENDEAVTDTDNEPAAGGEPSGDAGESRSVADDASEAKTPVDRPQTRADRRANALRTQTDRADKWERDAKEALERAQRLEREFGEFRSKQDELQRASQRETQVSQHTAKLTDLRKQWETHAAAASNAKLDAATRQQHINRAHELEDEMAEVQFLRVQEKHQANQPPDQSAQREAASREEQYLEARFPWLEGNKRAHRLAWAEFEGLVDDGKQRNRATMVQACTTIAAKFGFGGTNGNGANPNSRRYAMVPGGEGAGGEESSRGSPPKTEDNYRLAMGLYPALGKEQAFSKWSKRMQEKRAARESKAS